MPPLAGLASSFFIRFYKYIAPTEHKNHLVTDLPDILACIVAAGAFPAAFDPESRLCRRFGQPGGGIAAKIFIPEGEA